MIEIKAARFVTIGIISRLNWYNAEYSRLDYMRHLDTTEQKVAAVRGADVKQPGLPQLTSEESAA